MENPTRYAASQALLARAQAVIPGGHHLSGRPLVDAACSPMYFDRASGCRVWDVDGHAYIDLLMGYGPFVLGYADEAVDRAAMSQVARGPLVSLNHPMHVEFAERLVRRFPAAEMAIFLKTGSEATTAALRIARRHTGRKLVARCGYHGWHDWCLPLEDFAPAGIDAQVLEFRASDPDSLSSLLDAHPGRFAAVIVAPEMVLPHDPATFKALLQVTRRHGAVFVLDEVKTAFRTPPGSIQERVGIDPDLTTLSKALGNGWPVAAVVGRREVMRCAAGMHVSATYHGDTAAMAAAMATLDALDARDVAGNLWRLGEKLIDGLNAAAARHGVPAWAYGEPLPPMPFLRFTHEDPAANGALRDTFCEEALARGALLHPRHMWFVSDAHQPADIDRVLAAADEALAAVRARHGALLQPLATHARHAHLEEP